MGRSISASDLDEFPFEKYNHSRLKDLRYWLGINVNNFNQFNNNNFNRGGFPGGGNFPGGFPR